MEKMQPLWIALLCVSVDVPFTQGYAWRFKSKITVTTKSSDDVKLLSQLNRKLLNTFTLAVVIKMKVTAALLIIIYTYSF